MDGDGTIVFSDQTDNYFVRAEPDAVVAALGGAAQAASTAREVVA